MSEQSAKVFFVKSVFSPICKSFLPRKFPTIRYFLTHYLACATTIVCGYLLERTTQMVSTSFSLRATFRAPSRSQLPPPCSREDSHWCASVEHLQERRKREWYSQKMVFTENGIRNFYPKLLQLSCSECEILAKHFTVSPEPRLGLSIPDFASQLRRNFSRAAR